MKKIRCFILTILIAHISSAQAVEIIKKEALYKLFQQDSSIVVINFWTTWCKPCLQEMPAFRKADTVYTAKGVNFIFVSFDMVEDIEKVKSAIAKYKIPGQHFLLDESDLNGIIDSVDTGWGGGLPATWFVSPLYRKPSFINFEQYHDLSKEIELLIAASNETNK